MLAWYGKLEAGFVAEAAALAAAWERVRERDPELRGWVGGGDEGTAALVSDAMVDASFAIGTAEHRRSRIAEVRAQGIDRASA